VSYFDRLDRSRSSSSSTGQVPVAFEQERRLARSTRLGVGTLACPECDAPIAIGADRLAPADQLTCPFCWRHGRVREFLSLAPPSRPTRVVVRVRRPPIQAR
jgi:hypothetical protein